MDNIQTFSIEEMKGKMTAETVAKNLIDAILYDNGMVNRLEPIRYEPEWVEKISSAYQVFIDKNPSIVNDDVLEEIATGDLDEVITKYGELEGFLNFHNVLNQFFEEY